MITWIIFAIAYAITVAFAHNRISGLTTERDKLRKDLAQATKNDHRDGRGQFTKG